MLGAIDEKVRHFLMIVRRKGGVVNTVAAKATARALIERSNEEHLKCINIEHSLWEKSLFRRIGLVKRTCTTSKPEIPEKAKNVAELLFQHQVVSYVEQYSIPLFSVLYSLILSFDHTHLKYAPAANRTISTKGSKHVAIAGNNSQ